MSEKDRLELEQECLLKYSKAQTINKYIDELEENEKSHKELDYADNYNIYLIVRLDKIKEYIKAIMEEYGGDIYLTCKEINDLLEEIE